MIKDCNEELYNKLKNGNFENSFIVENLPKWLAKNDFYLVNAAIDGCWTKKDEAALSYIAITLHNRALVPDEAFIQENMSLSYDEILNWFYNTGYIFGQFGEQPAEVTLGMINHTVIGSCVYSIEKIISKLIEEGKEQHILLDIFSKSPIRNIRLHCANKFSNYSIFLEDEDERIRKVAKIRMDFNDAWQNKYSEEEKNFIDFLNQAIKNNILVCCDGLLGGRPDGVILARFEGPLFENSFTDWIHFDKDIFHNIKDSRILCAEIYRLGMNGQLKFASEFREYLERMKEYLEDTSKKVYRKEG